MWPSCQILGKIANLGVISTNLTLESLYFLSQTKAFSWMKQLIMDRPHTYTMSSLADFIPVKTIFLKLQKPLMNTEVVTLGAQLKSSCWCNSTASTPFLSAPMAQAGCPAGKNPDICQMCSGCSVATDKATRYCNASASWLQKHQRWCCWFHRYQQ